MKIIEDANDFYVRYGNNYELDRTDYDNLEHCKKFIEKIIKKSMTGKGKYKDITWFELWYEPSEEEDTQYLLESKERREMDVLGIKWKLDWN